MKALYWYIADNTPLCSRRADLPLQTLEQPPEDIKRACFLFDRPADSCRAAFAVSHPGQLEALVEDYTWLDLHSLDADIDVPPLLTRLIGERRLTAVNYQHPRWRELLEGRSCSGKKRVHVLAAGDVGGLLLTGLKLLGGNDIKALGLYDLRRETMERWEFELGQVSWPDGPQALPELEMLREEQLFDCDVFVFCATAGVPPLDGAVQDVRAAQYEKNRAIIAAYAAQAAKARFQGLFAVVSDPVDQLCRAAYEAAQGGLLAQQIEGYGLGVMNSRAAYFAKRDPRFSAYLKEGRAYGPHGEGLVIADSVEHYDDALSRELTQLTLTANLRARSMGFKPYIAPALSSGALSLLLTLRGEWHYSSTCLGKVWLGARNRRLPVGIEVEHLPLPGLLLDRLAQTYALLSATEQGGQDHA